MEARGKWIERMYTIPKFKIEKIVVPKTLPKFIPSTKKTQKFIGFEWLGKPQFHISRYDNCCKLIINWQQRLIISNGSRSKIYTDVKLCRIRWFILFATLDLCNTTLRLKVLILGSHIWCWWTAIQIQQTNWKWVCIRITI